MVDNLSVLIVGSGAREHAISQAYEKSRHIDRIIVAPGNDFIAYNRKKEVIIDKNCNLKKPESFLEIAKKYEPDLIDVAQDDALAGGTVDMLQAKGFQVFGPTKAAARIEWDKRWSREFMVRHGILHAPFKAFDSEEPAKEFVNKMYAETPDKVLYVKASGLCAGKGALKARNLDEAIGCIEKMKTFGEAGKVFLVEEGLIGEEFSYYAISDGKACYTFKSAQDNKTVFNFDGGDQTGGMGAVCPAKITEPISTLIESQQIETAVTGMKAEGAPYVGILYLGGISAGGQPINIEYNARWGDPECQAVLPSLETDYVEMVLACLDGQLEKMKIQQDTKSRVCVVGASRGYPDDYSAVKGKRIYGLKKAMEVEGVTVFGAGINVCNGKFYANGGRLFSVVGEGNDVIEARQKAYSAIAHISIEGNNLHYRTDIGWRDVERTLKELE